MTSFAKPQWIVAREYVVGDKVQDTTVVTEGVANRPSRTVYDQTVAVRDVTMGNRITDVKTLTNTDPEAKGTTRLLPNVTYVLNLGGSFAPRLPNANVNAGDIVRIRQGSGVLSDVNSVRIVGQDGGLGYRIDKLQYVDLDDVIDLNFDYAFIFDGIKWNSRSMTGGVGSLDASGNLEPVGDDDWMIIYQPQANRITIKELIAAVQDGLPDADTDTRGLAQVATDTEIRAGKDTWKIVSSAGLRKELPTYINEHMGFVKGASPEGVVPFVRNGKLSSTVSSPFIMDFLASNTNLVRDGLDQQAYAAAGYPPYYNANDGFRYTWNGSAWIKGTEQFSSQYTLGRFYTDVVTGRTFFAVGNQNFIDIASGFNQYKMEVRANQLYVPLGRRVQGKPLTSDITISPADIGTWNSAQIADYVNQAVNNGNNNPIVGATRWSGGRYYSFNGGGWVQVWPSTWL